MKSWENGLWFLSSDESLFLSFSGKTYSTIEHKLSTIDLAHFGSKMSTGDGDIIPLHSLSPYNIGNSIQQESNEFVKLMNATKLHYIIMSVKLRKILGKGRVAEF